MDTTPNTLTITLPAPIEFKGGKIEALTLREPTGKEALEAEKKLTGEDNLGLYRAYQLALVASASGVAAEALDHLPISTFREAFAFVDARLAAGLDGVKEPPPEMNMPLDAPIVAAGVTYDELRLHEPTAGDVRFAENGLTSRADPAGLRRYQVRLVSRVSGIPYSAAAEMPVSKLNAAAAYLQSFISGGLAIGPS